MALCFEKFNGTNMLNPHPLICVCIPVYQTEQYLERCLRSVITQSFIPKDSKNETPDDFCPFEILVVSDASRGKDEKGRSAKKIVHLMQKECNSYRRKNDLPPVKITFIEHRKNRGILEVRRTLTTQNNAEYVFHLDSDDEIMPGTLQRLWDACVGLDGITGDAFVGGEYDGSSCVGAGNSGAEPKFDIVHCTFESGSYDNNGNFVPASYNKCGSIYYGTIPGGKILSSWLHSKISGNLCGKLIRRSLVEEAYKKIPYTECNLGDDILIFFFISQCANNYIGIEDKLYRYRINSGMSSHRKIDSLERWRLVCSGAAVFTVISQWIKENQTITKEDVEIIRAMTRGYLVRTIFQLNETVVPELKQDAYQMLYEYWGKSFVERMEAAIIKALKNKKESEKLTE